MLDGTALRCYEWTQVKKPRAIIQIMPGFHEYLGRYSHFASQLNELDFIVVGGDHRGHGNSFVSSEDLLLKKQKRRGRSGKTEWRHYLDDQKVINSYIQKRWPSLPVYVVGQTLGATLATRYALDYGKTVNGLVLSGMTFPKNWKMKVVQSLAKSNKALHGSNKIDTWLNHLLSGTIYPKEKGRKEEVWISHDPNVREQLHHDPLISTELTNDFMLGFIKTLLYNSRKKRLNRLPGDFPILILAGKKDVVGNYTKQPRELKQKLKGLNKKVDLVTFPKWRNDVFSNPNPSPATKVFVEFLNKNL